MTNRSMQGKPVLPMTTRKAPSSMGMMAVWNDSMLSGVRVKPRSLKEEAGVKMPLVRCQLILRWKASQDAAVLTTTCD